LGYSPLPENLVQAAFTVVRRIPGHVDPPAIKQCANPTINGEFTDENTPPPPPDDKQDATPPPTDPGAGPTNDPGTGVITNGNTNNPTTGASGPSGATGPKKGGRLVAAGATGGGTDLATDQLAVSTGPISPPAQRDPLPLLLYVAAAVVALI